MESGENNNAMTEKMNGFASKASANTGLGFGIAGTVLGLGAMGLFGARGQGNRDPQMSPFVSTREFYDFALGQADRRFEDYKSMRDITDSLLEKLAIVNSKVDVAAATVPLAIEAEAAARKAADNILVSYMNGNFQPIEVADVTVGTTATPRQVYNPLVNFGIL